MCREAVLINGTSALLEQVKGLQANGGTRSVEIWQQGSVTLIHNRFDVTSEAFPAGTFPLENARYAFSYNGEVFEFRGQRFASDERYPSDVHFALGLIEEHGLDQFLQDVDFQGTYLLYDKLTADTYIIVDQLNTCGCFYASYGRTFVAASEHAVVNEALNVLGAPADTPINIVRNGTYLRVSKNGVVSTHTFRPDYNRVWQGTEYSIPHFHNIVRTVRDALVKATADRIPATGPVAVLAGGGVDSSLILTFVVKTLTSRGELDRLKVFTLGSYSASQDKSANDLLNAQDLLEHLQLDCERFLHIIDPFKIQEWRDLLLQTKVFSRNPRLITPNPVRTQMRHTVTMSCVLAWIVRQFPKIKTVLTGDAADELFAGYNSMRQGVQSAAELRTRVVEKLDDLPLNDAARVTLSSCHGVTAILKRNVLEPAIRSRGMQNSQTTLAENLESWTCDEIWHRLREEKLDDPVLRDLVLSIHPIEVRMPFTSHHVLRTLQSAHADYAVGQINGTILPKFLLRVVALEAGVPLNIACRPKVPFHEGGAGVRNAESDSAEIRAARAVMSEDDMLAGLNGTVADLLRLGITSNADVVDHSYVAKNFDKLAVVAAARSGGLKRMMKGNVFREFMRDSVYSTDTTGTEYVPTKPIECEAVSGRMSCRLPNDAPALLNTVTG
jgi:asparagine synthetase B (glutamine-hydrolysing)